MPAGIINGLGQNVGSRAAVLDAPAVISGESCPLSFFDRMPFPIGDAGTRTAQACEYRQLEIPGDANGLTKVDGSNWCITETELFAMDRNAAPLTNRNNVKAEGAASRNTTTLQSEPLFCHQWRLRALRLRWWNTQRAALWAQCRLAAVQQFTALIVRIRRFSRPFRAIQTPQGV